MNNCYVDLHIHIGRNKHQQPVKITASKNLSLTHLLEEASDRKGMDMIGVIDCHAPLVLEELEEHIERGSAIPLKDGGIRFRATTLILGSEIEVYDDNCKGPIHVLCYFATIEQMRVFSNWLKQRVTNIELSSQRYYGTAHELQIKVKELDGLFIPAHIFTPFKSLYGKGVEASLTEILLPELIDAVELGLSSDTEMAEQIKELQSYTFVTNSDAHSIRKIAREYQSISMNEATFSELKLALQQKHNRQITANFGMNPKLGKYHTTVCENCLQPLSKHQGPCSFCGHAKTIKGVKDRITELSTSGEFTKRARPPYVYQVPLDFVPGIGPKTLAKLLKAIGTEMEIIHHANEQDLIEIVGEKITKSILALRNGTLEIQQGGGGKYGRVINPKA